MYHEAVPNTTTIVTFCVVTYGCIAGLWLLYHTLSVGVCQQTRSNLRVAMLCITFCSMSCGMHVLNKSLVAALHAPCLLTAIQMAVSAILMTATSYQRFGDASMQQVAMWLCVPVLFSAMLLSSFYTYELFSLSLITVLRNLAPLVVLPIECAVMPAGKGPTITNDVVLSILLMIVGSYVYMGGLGEVSLFGLGVALFNMVMGISDRLIQRRLLVKECKGLPVEVCTVINNGVGLIPALALAFATAEAATAQEAFVPPKTEATAAWTDAHVLVLLALSCCVGLGISYFGLACQRAISATSVMVLQNVAKVGVVMAGIGFFHDPIQPPRLTYGLLLSLMGSLWYSKVQVELNAKTRASEDEFLVEKAVAQKKLPPTKSYGGCPEARDSVNTLAGDGAPAANVVGSPETKSVPVADVLGARAAAAPQRLPWHIRAALRLGPLCPRKLREANQSQQAQHTQQFP